MPSSPHRADRRRLAPAAPVLRLSLVVLAFGAAAGVGVWWLVLRLRGTERADESTVAATGETSVAARVERGPAGPFAGSPGEVAAPVADAGMSGAQAQDATPAAPLAAAVNPSSGGAVAMLLGEIQSAGPTTPDDETRRSGERAAFARAAGLDEVGKAAVEAAVDRFISAAEEVGANVAASPPAVPPAGGGAVPAAGREMIAQLADAYGRASEELHAIAGGRAGSATLSLGRQLPSGVRQQLLLLSGWLPAR